MLTSQASPSCSNLSYDGRIDASQQRAIPVYYYVFDLLFAEGCDTRGLPLRTRKTLLKRVLSFHDPVRFTAHRDEDGLKYLRDACRKGWEGLIAKDANASYMAGRSRDWLKFKCDHQQEFVILGFTEPHGSCTGFGALVIGYRSGDGYRSAGKVGTGFNHKQLLDLHKRLKEDETKMPPIADPKQEGDGVYWVKPKLVCEVGFTEWTSAGKLRHPRFLGVRIDKRPKEVVREEPVPA